MSKIPEIADPKSPEGARRDGPAADSGALEAALEADRGIRRRDFLRVGTTLAAGGALAAAGCQAPVENVLPETTLPEVQRGLGKPLFYATVHDGVPLVARNREGRPILVTPNRAHPAGLWPTLRTQAALLDLYDADRATGPLSVRRSQGLPVKSSWQAVSDEAVRALKASRDRIAIVVRPQTGGATRAALDEVARGLGARVVAFEPFQPDAFLAAWKRCFGDEKVPTLRLDRADLVVGLGADFLDVDGDRLGPDFAERRHPDAPGGMSRFVAFEGRLSLTGANADKRIRVRDAHLPAIACALAHEVVVAGKKGPLGGERIASLAAALDRARNPEPGSDAPAAAPDRIADLEARLEAARAAARAAAEALKPFAPDAVAAQVGVPADVLKAVAKALLQAGDKAVVVAGNGAAAQKGGVALHSAVNLLNVSVGSLPAAFDLEAWGTPHAGGLKALADLVADLQAGKVDVVIVAGPNPVHEAPGGLDVAGALARAKTVVSLNDRLDETSRLADWLAPASHAFESWGDADFPGDVHTVQQPLIRNLYNTYGLLDVLLTWAAQAGVTGDVTAAVAATKPADPKAPAPNASPAWHWVRAWWGRNLFGLTPGTPDFEAAWDDALRQGFWKGPASARKAPAFDADALSALGDAAPAKAAGLELNLHPHYAHRDGRAANNGWLHELPDPLTRATWGDWLAIAPKRFDALGLKNGDLVTVKAGAAALTLQAFRHAGLHEDVLALPLGLGRAACGEVGTGIGHRAFPLAAIDDGREVRVGIPVELSRAAGNEPLSITQGAEVLDRKPRPLVPVATLAEVRKDPKAGTEQEAGGPSIWPAAEAPGKQQWQMSIDLSRCNGCGKCVIGCQAENNIPVVGPRGVYEGREMSWIRIDRYWDAGNAKEWKDDVWDGPLAVVEEPVTLFEPMLCQHCGNAPCETVCPFVATMHSEDGLNQQVYNRCVGTRYCANNCPFKVRRYNWHEYSHAKTSAFFRMLVPKIKIHEVLNVRGRIPLKNNPEVTVRGRGVMEKCSFCVQRIREARANATREGRPGVIRDGEVVPACMEACPAQAITFGSVKDPAAKITKAAASPRAMRLLESIGVKPSISYLTRVRNVDGEV